MKLLFIDLETTGVMHWKNGVHQISGGVNIDGEWKEMFDYRVKPNPKAVIEPEALEVAGITLEDLVEYDEMAEVYKDFTAMLSRYVNKYDKTDKFFFVAYNAHFDNAFLRAFFKQNGDNYFGSFFWSNNIDVMILASQHLLEQRSKMPNFKLMTVAKTLGIDVDEEKLHDAEYDIHLTKKIYDIVTASCT